MAKTDFDVLEELCKPIVKYLHDNYDPHTTVVITDENARVERTELFVPIKIGD